MQKAAVFKNMKCLPVCGLVQRARVSRFFSREKLKVALRGRSLDGDVFGIAHSLAHVRKPANHKTARQNSSVCMKMCIELHSQKVPEESQSHTQRYT